MSTISRPQTVTTLAPIERDECMALLAATSVGRVVAPSGGATPLIRPVVYAFDEATQTIVFRSGEGSKLASLLGADRVAFEIDGFDPVDRVGWSVIVIGPVEEIPGVAERARADRIGPPSWVTGRLAHLLRIRPTVVSGRRIARG